MPACCPSGSWPQLLRSRDELNKDDVAFPPKGSIVKVPTKGRDSELPIYYVPAKEGSDNKGCIMVLPDIYSVRYLTPNVRSGDRIGSICDSLSEAGYNVALPSIFRHKPYDEAVKGPHDGDFCKFDSFAQDGGVDWFKTQTYDTVGPDVKACADFLNEKTGSQPIGVLGFCFGTWLLSKASSTGDVKFACAVGCHPATVLEKAVFGGDEEAMMNELKQPTLFLWAGNDSTDYTGDGPLKKALEKSGGGVTEYTEMLHGWVSRGDVSDPAVKRDFEKSLNEITSFFADKMPK